MRIAVLIAPFFLLLACASQDALDAQYAGAPLTAVFADLGPPDEANVLADGQTEYIWRAAAREDGVDSCFTRIVTDGGGTVVSAGKSDGVGRC
ncbi:hypothetical protein ACVDG3_13140 [Meridianimarinicoccus sp. RP-17]|uniref:hypothetical protein n=1 Tax=Meridianimarinicoccus zhengii TaxID=2056810 RepID=UPI000DAC648B|nr:hypothetical protein [Phycocomes zhengii]